MLMWLCTSCGRKFCRASAREQCVCTSLVQRSALSTILNGYKPFLAMGAALGDASVLHDASPAQVEEAQLRAASRLLS